MKRLSNASRTVFADFTVPLVRRRAPAIVKKLR
jgi:hypothetical protein